MPALDVSVGRSPRPLSGSTHLPLPGPAYAGTSKGIWPDRVAVLQYGVSARSLECVPSPASDPTPPCRRTSTSTGSTSAHGCPLVGRHTSRPSEPPAISTFPFCRAALTAPTRGECIDGRRDRTAPRLPLLFRWQACRRPGAPCRRRAPGRQDEIEASSSRRQWNDAGARAKRRCESVVFMISMPPWSLRRG